MSRNRSSSMRSTKRRKMSHEDVDTIMERMQNEFKVGGLLKQLPSHKTISTLSIKQHNNDNVHGNTALILGPKLCAFLTTTADQREHRVHFVQNPTMYRKEHAAKSPEECWVDMRRLKEKDMRSCKMEGPFQYFEGVPHGARPKLDALIKWYFIAKRLVPPEMDTMQDDFCKAFDQALRHIHSPHRNNGAVTNTEEDQPLTPQRLMSHDSATPKSRRSMQVHSQTPGHPANNEEVILATESRLQRSDLETITDYFKKSNELHLLDLVPNTTQFEDQKLMPENWRKRFRVAKNVDGEKHVYAYLRSVKNREEVALYYHNAHGHEPRYVGAGPVIKACKKKLLPPFNMVISANGSNDDNAKHRFNTLVRWIFVLSKQRKSILPKADDFAERLRSLLVFMKDRKAEIDGVTSDEESSEDPDNDSSDTQQNGGDQTTVYSYPLRAYAPAATPEVDGQARSSAPTTQISSQQRAQSIMPSSGATDDEIQAHHQKIQEYQDFKKHYDGSKWEIEFRVLRDTHKEWTKNWLEKRQILETERWRRPHSEWGGEQLEETLEGSTKKLVDFEKQWSEKFAKLCEEEKKAKSKRSRLEAELLRTWGPIQRSMDNSKKAG